MKSKPTEKLKVQPCVGCGYCCTKTLCGAAVRLYPGAKICPQLQWSDEDDRYFCGLMLIQGQLGEYYRKELYAGAGCCSGLNSWRRDVKKRSIADVSYDNPLSMEFQIFLRCFASQFVGSDSIQLILAQFKHELIKRDYTEENANFFCSKIAHTISENRHSFMKDFMG